MSQFLALKLHALKTSHMLRCKICQKVAFWSRFACDDCNLRNLNFLLREDHFGHALSALSFEWGLGVECLATLLVFVSLCISSLRICNSVVLIDHTVHIRRHIQVCKHLFYRVQLVQPRHLSVVEVEVAAATGGGICLLVVYY